jgi:hypothetical protein
MNVTQKDGRMVRRSGSQTLWLKPWSTDSVRCARPQDRSGRILPAAFLEPPATRPRISITDEAASVHSGEVRPTGGAGHAGVGL